MPFHLGFTTFQKIPRSRVRVPSKNDATRYRHAPTPDAPTAVPAAAPAPAAVDDDAAATASAAATAAGLPAAAAAAVLAPAASSAGGGASDADAAAAVLGRADGRLERDQVALDR